MSDTLIEPMADDPPMKQLAPFSAFRAECEKLKATAETLTVTSVDDVRGMALARTTRLALKEVRVAIDKRRKELGEHHLREKQRIDSDAKTLRELIEPLEERMLECEEFAERERLRIVDETRAARTAEIEPFLSAPCAVDLGRMSAPEYASMLADVMGAYAERVARAAREQAEALEKQQAEAIERERIRLENEQLKKEAIEREAIATKEREAAEAVARTERVAREKAEAKLKAAEDAEKKAAAAKISEAKKAEAAPDKAKLSALAAALRAVAMPSMATVEGKAAGIDCKTKIENLCLWIDGKANDL